MPKMQDDEHLDWIRANVRRLLSELPTGVALVAAAKSRTAEEVRAAAEGGVGIVGHNYVQEARDMRAELADGLPLAWHLIGHLQRNKAKAAVELFDLIETLDSWRLATALDGRAGAAAMTVPVLVEVNCAREQGKSGVMPEEAVDLAARIAGLEHLRLRGLMTIGPAPGDLAAQRACFRATHALLTELRHRLGARASECRELSMGMSHSYRMAIEEGATMVRIGTALFGPRPDGPACAARP